MKCNLPINERVENKLNSISVFTYGSTKLADTMKNSRMIDKIGVTDTMLDKKTAEEYFKSRGEMKSGFIVNSNNLISAIENSEVKYNRDAKHQKRLVLVHGSSQDMATKMTILHPLLHSMIGNIYRKSIASKHIESKSVLAISKPNFNRDAVMSYGKDYYNAIRIFGNTSSMSVGHKVTKDYFNTYSTIENYNKEYHNEWFKDYPTKAEELNKYISERYDLLQKLFNGQVEMHNSHKFTVLDGTLTNTPFVVKNDEKGHLKAILTAAKKEGVMMQKHPIPYGHYVTMILEGKKVEFIVQNELSFNNSIYFNNLNNDLSVVDYVFALNNKSSISKELIAPVVMGKLDKLKFLRKYNRAKVITEDGFPKLFFMDTQGRITEEGKYNSVPVLLNEKMKTIKFNGDISKLETEVSLALDFGYTAAIEGVDNPYYRSNNAIKIFSENEFSELKRNTPQYINLENKTIKAVNNILKDAKFKYNENDVEAGVKTIDVSKVVCNDKGIPIIDIKVPVGDVLSGNWKIFDNNIALSLADEINIAFRQDARTRPSFKIKKSSIKNC